MVTSVGTFRFRAISLTLSRKKVALLHICGEATRPVRGARTIHPPKVGFQNEIFLLNVRNWTQVLPVPDTFGSCWFQ